jgi:hypothetical protein
MVSDLNALSAAFAGVDGSIPIKSLIRLAFIIDAFDREIIAWTAVCPSLILTPCFTPVVSSSRTACQRHSSKP